MTAIAWTFIGLSGMAVLVGGFQLVLLFAVIPRDTVHQSPVPHAEAMPEWAAQVIRHPEWWVLAWFLVGVVTLISALGVLARQNWGRLILMAVLGCGTLWCLIAPWIVSQTMPLSVVASPPGPMSMIFAFAYVMNIVLSLGMAAALAWLARRLASREVREDFDLRGRGV